MAIYVTSDLHGFSHEKFKQLLSAINFSSSDMLYILGDMIDRNNDGGITTLFWITTQPNIELIRGNHEQMMLACKWMFGEVTDESIAELSVKKIESMNRWMANGSGPTMASLRKLLHSNPEIVKFIFEYISKTPLYKEITVADRKFILCHGGLGNFKEGKSLSEYTSDELLWTRPSFDDRYFNDIMTVIGHTPTGYYYSSGKAFKTETWIDIDMGVSDKRAPMFLRLDDMKEFYF